jgi:RHS repeat-associated protein
MTHSGEGLQRQSTARNPIQELSGGTVDANMLDGLGVDEYFQRADLLGTWDYLDDALGSTIALADMTGTVQTQYTYDPFGNTTTQGSASSNSYQFTGRENDGDGLYYYRARYYEPMMSRFIGEDPLRFGSGQKNFYAYVGDDPTEWIDPTGASACPFNCAANFAEQYSLAGALGINNPIGRAFLGNTFSNLVDAADHFDNDPVRAGEDLGLGGLRQGVIPGGGPLSKGIAGETTDAIVNAFGRSVTGAGSEPIQLGLNSSVDTAESILGQQAAEAGVTAIDLSGAEAAEALDWATPVGWAKLGWDAATFFVGLYKCW